MTAGSKHQQTGGAAKDTASPGEPEPLLDVRSVSKNFGALRAVDDVSFSVVPGRIFGIAGPNGSGKSTLFNLVSGIPFNADSGTIWFRGEEITRLSGYRIARAGLVRSFQKDPTFETLSARQTMQMAAAYGGSADRSTRQNIEGFLDRFEIPSSRRDEPSGTLPILEKKCLAIASALIMNPLLLLLDEPASGLTKPEVSLLDRHIVDLRAQGVTIMVIEHVLPLLLSVSDTLMVMNYGKAIALGTPREVINDPRVVEAYLGRRRAA